MDIIDGIDNWGHYEDFKTTMIPLTWDEGHNERLHTDVHNYLFIWPSPYRENTLISRNLTSYDLIATTLQSAWSDPERDHLLEGLYRWNEQIWPSWCWVTCPFHVVCWTKGGWERRRSDDRNKDVRIKYLPLGIPRCWSTTAGQQPTPKYGDYW
jgi:hypothetical protein